MHPRKMSRKSKSGGTLETGKILDMEALDLKLYCLEDLE